jgi:prepilin-type N-terminal cleavage/methylation domain-containing protein
MALLAGSGISLEAAVRTYHRKSGRQEASGFSLIEVMISIVLLTIGLLSTLTVFGVALKATQTSQEDLIARQLASEAIESVYTARNTSQLSWAAIQNVSNGGVFVDGPMVITCAGPDGIEGTADDTTCVPLTATGAACPGGVRCLTEPGPDGIIGTSDDQIVSLTAYTRQIQITPTTDVNGNTIPTLNAVAITISYTNPQTKSPKTYVINEYVSSYH